MKKARLFIQSYLCNYFFGIVEIYSDNTKIPSTQLINFIVRISPLSELFLWS